MLIIANTLTTIKAIHLPATAPQLQSAQVNLLVSSLKHNKGYIEMLPHEFECGCKVCMDAAMIRRKEITGMQSGTYLGDGLYAEDEGDQIKLWCHRDYGIAEVYLGLSEVYLFFKFIEKAHGCKITVTKNESGDSNA